MELTLPILRYRRVILDAVAPAKVTIITAETGAGKSTMVPMMLYGAGYRVVVTQPRRLAARSLAEYVAKGHGLALPSVVGYRTGEERCALPDTPLLYCTDGLQLVRELVGHGIEGRETILVLDEIHDWNLNLEVLVAWTLRRLEAGEQFKLVLMSATMDTERLAAFVGGNPPVVRVPGRLFPVKRISAKRDTLAEQVVNFARKGENILVFQPGKTEIGRLCRILEAKLGPTAWILPLHGEQGPEEQQMCFESAPDGRAKIIVATNVAQTSVTIPDITVVIDDGVERRSEVIDGIQGLYLRPISQADVDQRAGRAGRVREGTYVLCSDVKMEDRAAYAVPEILRLRLDQVVLRLAAQGVDAADLRFFHSPKAKDIEEAKRLLIALGAMTAKDGLTTIGQRMSELPLNVRYARMLVSAEHLGVVPQVAAIAACLEAGDIRMRPRESKGPPAWRRLTSEARSDLLAVYDVWKFGKPLLQTGRQAESLLERAGIFSRNFLRAEEIRDKILTAIERRIEITEKKFRSPQAEREAILQACLPGFVDHLFHLEGDGYRGNDPHPRRLDDGTALVGKPEWIVGNPRDFESGKDDKRQIHRLVAMATAVEPRQLMEIAPHLIERNPTGMMFNGRLVVHS